MAASDVNDYFMGLVTGSAKGALPEIYGEINSSHGIKRIARIKAALPEDDCGVAPFRITNRHAGNLSQCPISASHHVMVGGAPIKGEDEERRNKVRRTIGGPLPTDNLVLHLVAEDLYTDYAHNATVTGSWKDNSGQGNDLAVTTTAVARPVYRNDSPKEYSNVKFLGDESYFSLEVGDSHALASMVNKVVYVVFNADEDAGVATPGNQFTVKTDSTAQGYALTIFAARNVSGDIDLKKMTVYDTAADIKTGSENTGDDFGITADDVAADSLENEMLAELYIYDFSTGTPHTDDEMKNNMNNLFCKYLKS
jgi:hypothetical protein